MQKNKIQNVKSNQLRSKGEADKEDNINEQQQEEEEECEKKDEEEEEELQGEEGRKRRSLFRIVQCRSTL